MLPAAASYRLSLLTLESAGKLLFIRDALLVVSSSGRILSVGPAPKRMPPGTKDYRGCLAIPGMIDAHCHLSQYPAVAKDGLELLPWLSRHIFPLEREFRGAKARPWARHFFAELAAHGTTCAAVYTSIWKDSTRVCFEEALDSGLRVIMGKVMMDRGSYDTEFTRHNPRKNRRVTSLRESEELCKDWHGRGAGRILYAFTPRFALSCSPELLRGAALLAQRYGAYVQTHLAENRGEVLEARRMFPQIADYASVYARAGLLGPRTILAHSIWLSEREYRLLERHKPAVAYCPTSNAFLSSGIMNAARMRQGDVPVALGSDVAGGPTLDLFEVMRQAVYHQRLAQAHGLFAETPALSCENAFYMATLGGARALKLSEKIGSLEAGKEADFVLLDPAAYQPWPRGRAPVLNAAEALALLVYRASQKAIRAVFVAGRRVHHAPEFLSSAARVSRVSKVS